MQLVLDRKKLSAMAMPKSVVLTTVLPSKLLRALAALPVPKSATYMPKSRMSTVLSSLLSPCSRTSVATYAVPDTLTVAALRSVCVVFFTLTQVYTPPDRTGTCTDTVVAVLLRLAVAERVTTFEPVPVSMASARLLAVMPAPSSETDRLITWWFSTV